MCVYNEKKLEKEGERGIKEESGEMENSSYKCVYLIYNMVDREVYVSSDTYLFHTCIKKI